MTTLVVNVSGRIRRKRLVFGTIAAASTLSPIIGRRAAIAIANRAARWLRVDYRVDNGKWLRLSVDMPQIVGEP